ncbi:MAG: cyclic nucleotide-binding domain-containing protein [Lachnospira sp.]|nr:cyclic nucleotide-binding domain-containing protein [Lachnospira sp.]
METINVLHDQIIEKKNDIVKNWYLIKEGSVIQKFDYSEIRLEKDSIIGIHEKDIFMCDYIAAEDTVLVPFNCTTVKELKEVLNKREDLRGVFLRSAILQRHNMLCLYSEWYDKARQFHMFVEKIYDDYKTFCNRFKVEEKSFGKMEHFKPLQMRHRAEAWEVNNSISIVKKYLGVYLELMEMDDSLTIGVIMETSAQMRRFALGIGEMEAYLSYNKDILVSESQNDIFRLYFDMAVTAYAKKHNIDSISEKIESINRFVSKFDIYNKRMINRRFNEYKNYDFTGEGAAESKYARIEMDITAVDGVTHILQYAGYNDSEVELIATDIEKYRDLPDKQSGESDVYALRKKITKQFYEIYYRAFMRSVNDDNSLTPVVEMFLNFGFMDISFVGEEHAKALYDLTAHLDVCESEHIFTIYSWLKAIYNGEKEPSKNEFDMNYPAYLADQRRMANITEAEFKEYMDDPEKKVEFEINSMFASVNRATYGKITTFCPILCEYDLINSIDKMLITAERIENAVNEVRKVDFSAFYREITYSDPAHGINTERIMKEVLPDIILMPNAGSRVMMWQETAGVKTDSPARFMFPMFTSVDLDDMMLEVIGRYRWEICRKVQGVHWNDVREKSLTAEFCTYIQFYRNNHDLSAEAKEKIKNSLARAKNNYREVFVRDYISWIKFESKGSFRLNKFSREILISYCPFVKTIRDELKTNPLYQSALTRFDNECAKKLQRYNSVYDKYTKAGGEIGTELKDNLLFYSM